MQEQKHTQEDEIDLRELFKTIKDGKKIIFLTMFLFTLISIIYVLVTKPIYSGQTTIEIGVTMNSENINSLDNIYTLIGILDKKYNISSSNPKNSNLLVISTENSDKKEIEKQLKETTKYILNRDRDISILYKNQNYKIIMTKVISPIKISDYPTKPKKKLILIVAFITGLMFSIFLLFFLSFIKSMREDKE